MNQKPNNYLDPIAATEQPRADFIRYLLTAYPLRDPHLRYGLKKQLEQPGVVWQHPYLESSQPYKAASSVSELVDRGILHPEMTNLFTPSDRSLYEHQEKAVKTFIEQQQNFVVATGTGSGKTECFLIPMLDLLLREEENLFLPGVRALILYPMNALVNDQVKRLRKLLARQETVKIRFGFYTSRTERNKKQAKESLRNELQAYESKELKELFTEAEQQNLDLSTREKLVEEAFGKILRIQAVSREEIWDKPPHILVTNYSMLEHMLIRPKERKHIFEASASTFKMLVVDEAHTYNGSTGSEVSMLLERLKVAVGVEKGQIRCIATSASLGDASVDGQVLQFAQEFFGESFNQVIRGDRISATARLGSPYELQSEFTDEEIFGYLSILKLPDRDANIEEWSDLISSIVPQEQIAKARSQAGEEIHKFLWFALKQHPLIHRLIDILSRQPQSWEQVVCSSELWKIDLPVSLDGSIDDTDAKKALARLLQLGTLAREHPEDLPLLPVRLHLLFRSLEGLYACINPNCSDPDAELDPNYKDKPRRYGRLYLNEKKICDCCSSPVLELGSCSQCGQAFAFTQVYNSKLESLPRSNQGLRENPKIYTLTSGLLDSVTEEEDIGEVEEQESSAAKTFIFRQRDGWIGIPSNENFPPKNKVEGEFYLPWHRQKDAKDLDGCYLPKCAACGIRPIRAQAINRFVTYTDEPLQATIDSLFELLPEPDRNPQDNSERKLLTFSDGRQDAAFFAADFQRNRTEMVYRQMIWQAFQSVKGDDDTASVTQVVDRLKRIFLEQPIPHPDRNSQRNYLNYCPGDKQGLENKKDCEDAAQSRAKELLLREFALSFNRRSTLEAFALLTCHLEFSDERLIELVAKQFEITQTEARIFLIVLTDIIRRTGIVSIEGASRYFSETGGVEGMRPEMINSQGQSKNYLFLEKLEDEKKKYRDSPSFLPKWKKDGQISQAQNRLGWYYYQLFGEEKFPSRENLIWLFRQLHDSHLFLQAQQGYHLNWKLLNIIKSQHDWYQCDRCQQIFHIPGLSEIDKTQTKLNVFGCSTFKCKGTLQSYTPNERAIQEHYLQYFIKNRSPLPLRSQEHTAQLGVSELEKRENRFRSGKINLLSCSTTLEMGVDIGELQAVVLRNFPPHVSNYQQRAGRAGRRTDGVAITLMYGQRRPHDRFYFEKPELLIAGSNQIPKLDIHNLQIQQRHIRAELLAAFLNNRGIGAENVTMADFFELPWENPASNPDFIPPSTAMICELQEWLYGDEAKAIAQSWITRLKASANAIDLLSQFKDAISTFQQNQLSDWNDLVLPLTTIKEEINAENDRKKRQALETRRNRTEAELEKIAKRRLHDELVQASILPIYGFPIDVVRLLTGESSEYKSSQGKHRLERDRRLALGEYAPGQEIVVDDRVYRSVGILRPKDLEQKYYWICKQCNNFQASHQEDIIEQCSVCSWETTPPSAKKMKPYKVPKSFTTDWTEKPQVTPYIKPQRQPTSQVFLANEGDNFHNLSHHFYNLTVSQGGKFFLANQGLLGQGKGFEKQGFAICQNCGRDLSNLMQKEREANNKKGSSKKSNSSSISPSLVHTHPITGKNCSPYYEFTHLGHEFRSDLLKIQFAANTNPMLLFGEVTNYLNDRTVSSVADESDRIVTGLDFWRSLTYALLAAAAQVIDVPRTELDGLFRPLADGLAEIIIYDNVPGGAGYSRRIAEKFSKVLEGAYTIVAGCTCDTSCYDCLRTYSNQPFHAELNRNLVADFLRPIVEKLSPDPELQNFAPDANRVSLAQIADRLSTLCRGAGSESIIYLSSLIDEFNLNNGSPLSWLKILTETVYSLQRSETSLELIVDRLPKSNTNLDSDRRHYLQVLQKRLQQWINLGLLKLYESPHKTLPILCFSTQQSNRIAIELHQNSDTQAWEWFQTQSFEGVEKVFSRVKQLRSQARLVLVSELEDPDTSVIFPEPSWGELSLQQLRQKLCIEQILIGSEVKKVTYSDRYLNGEGAKILSELLKEGLNPNTELTIRVLENKEQSASERKAELEKALSSLKDIGIFYQVKVQPQRETRHFCHARILEVYRRDGLDYKIIFDSGIDFLQVKANKYLISKPTYVVVTR